MKQHIKFIPLQFQTIIGIEVDALLDSNQLIQGPTIDDRIQKGFRVLESLIQEQKNKNIFNNLSRFAKQLKVLIKLLLIKLLQQHDYLNENDALIAASFIQDQIYDRFFNLLRSNLNIISYATTLVNYDQEFLNLIEVSFRNIRKCNQINHINQVNIQTNNQINELQQISSKIRLNSLQIYNQPIKSSQIINHIDQILMTSSYDESDPESHHKNNFMTSLSQDPNKSTLQEALRHLQLCILYNPSLKKYRNVLDRYSDHSRKYNNTIFQASIKTSKLQLLQLCSFREMKWLDILLNQMSKINPQSENYDADIDSIYKIIKYKLLNVKDPQIQKSIQKIVVDLTSLIEIFPPQNIIKQQKQIDSIRDKTFKIATDKSQIMLQIQKNTNTSSIVKTISSKLLPFEDQDYIYSKKIVGFLLPVILSLYKTNPNNKLILLSQEVLQHCLYAEQTLTNDLKLKKSRFILNLVIYSLSIHQLESQDVAGTLTNLKNCADEFLSQGTFNSLSLSLYIHYTIVTERYDDLSQWLKIVGGYKQNKDFIAQWGLIVQDKQQAQKNQDIERIRLFRRSTDHFIKNNRDLFSSPLTSLLYFLQGQVMMSSTDFQQYFTKEQVLTRYQLSCFYYPSQANQIIKLLQPLKDAKRNKLIKANQDLDSDYEEELRMKEVEKNTLMKKKDKEEGLNSESDEDEVRLMDYEKDIEEYPELMNQMQEEQMEYQDQEYSEEYMQAMMQQQQQQAYMTPEQYSQMMIENARLSNLETIQQMGNDDEDY